MIKIGTMVLYIKQLEALKQNIHKALAGTSWGQQKETIMITYKAVGRLISTTLRLFGVQTYTTPTTEKSNIHRTRL